MRNVIYAGLLVLGLAACGKADEALKELDAIKKTACECKDPACVEKAGIDGQISAWKSRHAQTKGSESQKGKADQMLKDIAGCVEKAQTPPTDAEDEKDQPAPK